MDRRVASFSLTDASLLSNFTNHKRFDEQQTTEHKSAFNQVQMFVHSVALLSTIPQKQTCQHRTR